VYPYLIRTIGSEKFGIIAYSHIVISYFLNFIDYGFGLYMTREIANNKNHINKLRVLFSSAMLIKLMLVFCAFAVYMMLVFSVNKFYTYKTLYLLSFGVVFCQSMFPTWFFQGLEKMQYIAIFSFFSQMIYLIGVFFLINKPEDFLLVPLLLTVASFGYAFGGIVKSYFELDKRFVKPSMKKALDILCSAFPLALSSMLIKMFKNNVIIMLGFFAPYNIVGYFTIAKKIVDALSQVSNMISQTIFPHIVYNIGFAKQYAKTLLKKTIVVLVIINCLIVLFLFYLPDWVLVYLTGSKNDIVRWLLKTMSIVPLIIAINVPALQWLLGMKYDKLFAKIILVVTVLDLLFCYMVIPIFSYKGAALVVIVTETIITTALYYTLSKKRGIL
jgi:PST family polysaccharide transporter